MQPGYPKDQMQGTGQYSGMQQPSGWNGNAPYGMNPNSTGFNDEYGEQNLNQYDSQNSGQYDPRNFGQYDPQNSVQYNPQNPGQYASQNPFQYGSQNPGQYDATDPNLYYAPNVAANGMPYPGQGVPYAQNPINAMDDSYQNFVNNAPLEPIPQQVQGKKARKKVKKKHHRGKPNFRLILLVVIVLAVIGGIAYLLLSNRSSSGGTAQIQLSQMGETHTGSALIVRDETAYDEEGVQDIDFNAKEGSIVTRGNVICYVYSTGYTAKEVSTLQGYRDQIKDYQASLLSAETSYDQKMTRLENEIIDRGLEIRSMVQGARGDFIAQEESLETAITERQSYFRTKYSSDTRMSRLYDDENTQLQRIDSWIKQKIATTEGIVSFYTDGFESLLTPYTYESYSPSQVASMIAGNKLNQTSASRGRTNLYRLVQQGNYVVLLLVDDASWNPEKGRVYNLVLERYNDLVSEAMVLSYTRAGGQLLVRLAVMGDVQDVLYMRTCNARLDDYVDAMMVPSGALYEQNGMTGVVVIQNGKNIFTPVTVLQRSGNNAYISAVESSALSVGMTVKLFK